MRITVSHSININPEHAADELIAQAQLQAPDETALAAAVLLASKTLDSRKIQLRLLEQYRGLPLVGGTTLGEISSHLGSRQGSAVLILFYTDETQIVAGVCRDLSAGVEASVVNAMSQHTQSKPPALCLIFSESLSVGGDAVALNIRRLLGENLPIFGGLTADIWQFNETNQFYGAETLTDSVPFLLFYGDRLQFSYGVGSGWTPIGEAAEVTDSIGNNVRTINHLPAIEFYNRYIGGWPEVFGEYPLLVEFADARVLRAPLKLDTESGSIVFAGDVPIGARIQITVASRDEILGAATTATTNAMANYKGTPAIVFVTSCAARFFVLGSLAGEECGRLALSFSSTPVAGFYGYGEFGPCSNQSTHSALHNETFICLLLGEV